MLSEACAEESHARFVRHACCSTSIRHLDILALTSGDRGLILLGPILEHLTQHLGAFGRGFRAADCAEAVDAFRCLQITSFAPSELQDARQNLSSSSDLRNTLERPLLESEPALRLGYRNFDRLAQPSASDELS